MHAQISETRLFSDLSHVSGSEANYNLAKSVWYVCGWDCTFLEEYLCNFQFLYRSLPVCGNKLRTTCPKLRKVGKKQLHYGSNLFYALLGKKLKLGMVIWSTCRLHRYELASYPGLLAPVFIACSTNAGEGLVKLSHVVWCTWTCGGVAHSFCTVVKQLSESKKRRQDCLMSSAQLFYGPYWQLVAHLLTCCFFRECATPPHVQVCHTTVTQFYQAFPRVSTASNKRWGKKAWVRG